MRIDTVNPDISNKEQIANNKQSTSNKMWTFALLGLFLIRIFPFLSGNYLYDEAISLSVYVIQKDNIFQIFRDYSMANNHFLSNAIYWLWLAVIGKKGLIMECLTRLPSLLCGIGSILIVLYHWRKFIGEKKAWLAALLIALSPVYSGFAWQVRGYSLIFFLGIALVAASLHRLRQMTVWNGLTVFLLSLLLPLAMPSSVMLPAAVGAGMCVAYWIATRKVSSALRLVFPVFIGVFLGGGYYLTLGSQFWASAKAAGGWDSFWKTIGNISLAIVFHCGIFSIGIPVLLWQALQRILKAIRVRNIVPECDVLELYPSLLALSVIAVILGLLLCSIPTSHYPFPRVFLLMLAPLTFTVMSTDTVLGKMSFWKQIALTVLLAVLVNAGCDLYVKYADSDYSRPCQNLLVQRWRGRGIFYDVASIILAEYKETGEAVTLIDGNWVPSVGFYCQIYDLAWLKNEFKAVMDVEWLPRSSIELARQRGVKIKILSRSEEEARDILKKVSFDFQTSLSVRKQYGDYTYYVVNITP